MLLRKSLYLGKKSLSLHRTFSWGIKWLERIPYNWPTTEMSLFLARNFGMQWHEWYLLLYLVESRNWFRPCLPGNTWESGHTTGAVGCFPGSYYITEYPKVKERDISYVNYADDMHSIHLQKFPSSCTVRWSWHRTPQNGNVWWYSSPTLHRFADDYACISKILDGPDSSICWRNTSNKESDSIAHHCISTTLL